MLDGAADDDFDGRPRSIREDLADRQQTAKVIATANAEFVALQEVFDTETLDFFHDHFLLQAGLEPYPFRVCLSGNDGRGLNVAAMSKRKPVRIISHAQLTGADFNLTDLPTNLRNQRLFRRDCLQLDFDAFTLFICHFKAPYPDTEKSYVIREAEARAVRKIIETRFSRPENERWMIMGDFNEPASVDQTASSALNSLKQGFSFDLLDRLPRGKDWTFEVPDTHVHSRPDRIFLSPKLAQEYPDVVPTILRTGMIRYLSEPASMSSCGAPNKRSNASDHALVYADFPGL